MNTPCPFCNVEPERIVAENSLAIAVLDNYPVSEGHTLVVPREHKASLFELSAQTQAAMWQLVGEVRHKLNLELTATGFNIGLNDGTAAGQTVMHAHIHVIPRFKDDVLDPRGGIRWVLPDKAKYWTN
jgi:diadenosine tetraphosphate (Ap4A) HIT family hydrolase